MAVALPWRDAPDWAFREWLRQTFRHARSPMFRMPDEWAALMRFAASRRRHVIDLTPEELRAFLGSSAISRSGRKCTARCRRLLELLSMAFEDIRREGLRGENPVEPLLVEYPAVSRPLPIVLSPAQRAALGRLLYGRSGSWQAVRNRALALLVLVDSMRPAEITALTLRDVGFQRRRLTGPTRNAINAWLGRRSALAIPGDRLFPANEHGAAYTPLAVYRLVRSMLRRAGIDAHTLSRLDIRDCLAPGRLAGSHRDAISVPTAPVMVQRSRPGGEQSSASAPY